MDSSSVVIVRRILEVETTLTRTPTHWCGDVGHVDKHDGNAREMRSAQFRYGGWWGDAEKNRRGGNELKHRQGTTGQDRRRRWEFHMAAGKQVDELRGN